MSTFFLPTITDKTTGNKFATVMGRVASEWAGMAERRFGSLALGRLNTTNTLVPSSRIWRHRSEQTHSQQNWKASISFCLEQIRGSDGDYRESSLELHTHPEVWFIFSYVLTSLTSSLSFHLEELLSEWWFLFKPSFTTIAAKWSSSPKTPFSLTC